MVCGQGGLFGIRRGGKTFGGLGLQGRLDGSSVRNIFEDSFTEELTVSRNYIFEGVFKFVSSVSRNNFDNTASENRGVIEEKSGRNPGVIGE